MTDETIVAVYDTEAHATAAVRELENSGVPSSAITQHAKGGITTGSARSTVPPGREEGFWSSLFGGEPEHAHDATVYNRSLESGGNVVAVKAPDAHLTKIMEILGRHNPIDIDERAASYALGQTTAPPRGTAATRTTAGSAKGDETIQLAEEKLATGKRAINRGTTRIRRYVVETPVEEQVTLRDETVSVERRPVSGSRPVTGDHFTDKVVEVTATGEEAVVSKKVGVKEEVVIHKDAAERTETVRDTVRREDVEITKDGGVERPIGTPAPGATAPNNPKV
jgi:uncharacterized protein (TIGR02271 family)